LISPLVALSRERLVDRAAEAIKDYVVRNELQTNDRLPSENEFSQSLQVSRNVVRQALSSLEAVGIVRTEHGRGTFVADWYNNEKLFQNLSLWQDLGNLDDGRYFELRLAFESGILQLVMQKATDDDFDRLDELARWVDQEPACPQDDHPHRLFHQALLDTIENSFLASVGMVLTRYMFWLCSAAPRVQRIPDEDVVRVHQVFTAGLRQRDPALIPSIVAVHIGHIALDPGCEENPVEWLAQLRERLAHISPDSVS